MSEFIATEYAELQSSGHPPDLQVHLYKEIGISALVAALHVMTKSLAPRMTQPWTAPCVHLRDFAK